MESVGRIAESLRHQELRDDASMRWSEFPAASRWRCSRLNWQLPRTTSKRTSPSPCVPRREGSSPSMPEAGAHQGDRRQIADDFHRGVGGRVTRSQPRDELIRERDPMSTKARSAGTRRSMTNHSLASRIVCLVILGSILASSGPATDGMARPQSLERADVGDR